MQIQTEQAEVGESPPSTHPDKHSSERTELALCERSLVPLLSCLCSWFSSDGVSIVVFLPSDKNAPFQQILLSCSLLSCSLFRSHYFPHVSATSLLSFSRTLTYSPSLAPSPASQKVLYFDAHVHSLVLTRSQSAHQFCLYIWDSVT